MLIKQYDNNTNSYSHNIRLKHWVGEEGDKYVIACVQAEHKRED